MFDKAIIDTDRFMDLPVSAKALYFLLGMDADDEGFVSPRKIQRVHGGSEDDIKVLIAKNFVIPFKSGIVVITDWNNNNWLDSRRIKPTKYQEERKLLALNKDRMYTLSIGLADVKPEECSIEESSIVAGATLWSFEEEIKKLKESPRKDYKIIALYWNKKGWNFKNKDQFNSALTRELKPAKNLKGYNGEEISRSMDFCMEKYPEIWTLETCFKRIQDIVNK